MIVIGFTGTQRGMTKPQWDSVIRTVMDLRKHNVVRRAVHGDCVGSDAQFDRICEVAAPSTKRGIRPCNIPGKRAHCEKRGATLLADPKPPLVRNQDIVDDCTVMIATPGESHEELRSGTWATIRRARKAKKPIIIVWPDGTIKREGP